MNIIMVNGQGGNEQPKGREVSGKMFQALHADGGVLSRSAIPNPRTARMCRKRQTKCHSARLQGI